MKLKLLPLLIATLGVASAAPEGLRSGIPAFLDTDGDGVISEAERQAFVESRKATVRGRVATWDTNGDGVVDAAERLAAVQALRAKVETRRSELFTRVAGDDGLLDVTEFAKLPALARVPQDVITRMFALLDSDGDGSVTLTEFLAGVRVPTPPTLPGR